MVVIVLKYLFGKTLIINTLNTNVPLVGVGESDLLLSLPPIREHSGKIARATFGPVVMIFFSDER